MTWLDFTDGMNEWRETKYTSTEHDTQTWTWKKEIHTGNSNDIKNVKKIYWI